MGRANARFKGLAPIELFLEAEEHKNLNSAGMPRPDPYSAHADALIKLYESVRFEEIHGSWAVPLLGIAGGKAASAGARAMHPAALRPSGAAHLALDVGAGSGRDAAALAALGFEVVALEPSAEMRRRGQELHSSPRIRWLDDALPALTTTHALGLRFDLILLSGVWQQVAPTRRQRAFRKLQGLLRPGGLLVITLRLGPPDRSRGMHPVTAEELQQLARRHALEPIPLTSTDRPDTLGRSEIRWTTLIYRSPDDGTGALPLLRHIIINDAKSSTYKLALLRVLLRIADGSRGMVLARDDRHVTLPLGLVGLYWLRAFKPLLLGAPGPYPQLPGRSTGLGFVKDGFRALAEISPYDLAVGARFGGADARNLVLALRDACRTIKIMPATYTNFPDRAGEPVFEVTLGEPSGAAARQAARPRNVRLPEPGTPVVINRETLARFGRFKVPIHVWDALSRFACWIEPAVIEEWVDLMAGYDEKLGARRSSDHYRLALRWLDPRRRSGEVRRLIAQSLEGGLQLHCVWSGARLRPDQYDVDHCFPFAHWPNNDLWNLLPSTSALNQKKADRLPSAAILHDAHDRIVAWWEVLTSGYPLDDRFFTEAYSALPLAAGDGPGPIDRPARLERIFMAVDAQRMRLRADQRIAEWPEPG